MCAACVPGGNCTGGVLALLPDTWLRGNISAPGFTLHKCLLEDACTTDVEHK